MINQILAFFRWSHSHQKWSRGHKARGQGQKKIWSQDQGQECSRPRTKDTSASVLQKKKVIKIFFLTISKKRSSQIFRKVSGVFQRNFNDSKNSAVIGRGQGNFRRFVGFEAKAKDLKMCPRGLHLWYSHQAWSQKPCCFYWCFVGHNDQHHPPNQPSQSFHQPPLISCLSPSGTFGPSPPPSPTTPP